jgi:archaellum component FlaF (FlaF/FlaG flagellin family)
LFLDNDLTFISQAGRLDIAWRTPGALLAGTTTRVSIASDGTQGNGVSWNTSISADGRYVAFHSTADNPIPGDTNGYSDVFVHDQQTGQTQRVSVASNGTQGNGNSHSPSISADGRYVAFVSAADNLVPGDTNDVSDVFVHERAVALPSLSINYPDGQPGSFFTVTGSNFPPNSTAAVIINGVTLTTSLPVDSSGEFLFLLNTEHADAGHYFVTVTANPGATVSFILDPAAPLRPQVDSGAIFQVPDGIALTEFIYLPLIQR